MSDQRPTDLLGSLPRTRPHRRSDKRGAPPVDRKPPAPREARRTASPPKPARSSTTTPRKSAGRPAQKRLRQPAQPRGIPAARRAPKRKPAPTSGMEIVGTAVQAVGELAEIGMALSARALRNALGRLPRP
jgi:hypothetical protein